MVSIEAAAELASGALRLQYVVAGRLQKVVIPARREPQFAGGLWRHTCFECFAAKGAEDGYSEFNLSPSGEWAAYGFDGYRAGMRPLPIPDPRIAVKIEDDRLVLQASIPVPPRGAGVRCALTAVIEEQDGRVSYWALAHAPGRPDFHRREGFILAL